MTCWWGACFISQEFVFFLHTTFGLCREEIYCDILPRETKEAGRERESWGGGGEEEERGRDVDRQRHSHVDRQTERVKQT